MMLCQNGINVVLIVFILSPAVTEGYEANDTSGLLFFVAFPSSEVIPQRSKLVIAMSTLEANANVAIDAAKIPRTRYTFDLRHSIEVKISWPNSDHSHPHGKAITIASDRTITVLLMLTIDGVHLALTYLPPVNIYDFEYYLSLNRFTKFDGLWALVLACDNTKISYKVCEKDMKQHCGGEYIKTYTIQSENYFHLPWQNHTVGDKKILKDAFVRADKPILLMTGTKTSIEVPRSPTTWAKEYVVILPSIGQYTIYLNKRSDEEVDAKIYTKTLKEIMRLDKSNKTGYTSVILKTAIPQYKMAFIIETSNPVAMMIYREEVVPLCIHSMVSPIHFPNQIFYRIPSSIVKSAPTYLYLILRLNESGVFIYNGLTIIEQRWSILGSSTNMYKFTRIRQYVRDIKIRHQYPLVHFGSFLLRRGEKTETVTQLGVLTRPPVLKAPPDCNVTYIIEGDRLDNDCDGRYDEEEKNMKDDDGDEAIDEDLIASPIKGHWSKWSAWNCPTDCGTTSLFRHNRTCTNPFPANMGLFCQGRSEEVVNVRCRLSLAQCEGRRNISTVYTFEVTRDDKPCHRGLWGVVCEGKCNTKCRHTICERVYGYCHDCVKGYYSKFCNLSCPFECPMNCSPKDGICQNTWIFNSSGVLIGVLPLIIIMALSVLLLFSCVFVVLYCRSQLKGVHNNE